MRRPAPPPTPPPLSGPPPHFPQVKVLSFETDSLEASFGKDTLAHFTTLMQDKYNWCREQLLQNIAVRKVGARTDTLLVLWRGAAVLWVGGVPRVLWCCSVWGSQG